MRMILVICKRELIVSNVNRAHFHASSHVYPVHSGGSAARILFSCHVENDIPTPSIFWTHVFGHFWTFLDTRHFLSNHIVGRSVKGYYLAIYTLAKKIETRLLLLKNE